MPAACTMRSSLWNLTGPSVRTPSGPAVLPTMSPAVRSMAPSAPILITAGVLCTGQVSVQSRGRRAFSLQTLRDRSADSVPVVDRRPYARFRSDVGESICGLMSRIRSCWVAVFVHRKVTHGLGRLIAVGPAHRPAARPAPCAVRTRRPRRGPSHPGIHEADDRHRAHRRRPEGTGRIAKVGRTLKKRAEDVPAPEAVNGRLEHLRGSAPGSRNPANDITRSLLETGGFRPQLNPIPFS